MLSQGPSSSAHNAPHKMLALTQGSPSGFFGTSQASASTPGRTAALNPLLPVMQQGGDRHDEIEKSTSMAILSPGTISEATSAPGSVPES
uniref:Uncharacterized protein n=1 Tax=Arundo donax TaxID=35708 RepID=A0A0A9ESV8_ARUDO